MEINASAVKELRERTGAGMMDCKKVLVEAAGDVERAIELLREKGLAAAVKKSGRIAAEGVVAGFVTDDKKCGVIAEVNCETDFVAKTPEFGKFVGEIAAHLSRVDTQLELEKLVAQPGFSGTATIQDVLTEKVATIGENVNFRRFEKYVLSGNGIVENYIHMGGKIGVMVALSCKNSDTESNPDFKQLARDVAMQIAAANPLYIKVEQIDPEVLEKEKQIFTAMSLNEGKPANIVEKMVVGRLKKYEKEICLIEQPFVKEMDITVSTLLKNKGKEFADELEVVYFKRFEMGEGLAKREDDFVAEVMKQAGN